jgi:hypothetical protein
VPSWITYRPTSQQITFLNDSIRRRFGFTWSTVRNFPCLYKGGDDRRRARGRRRMLQARALVGNERAGYGRRFRATPGSIPGKLPVRTPRVSPSPDQTCAVQPTTRRARVRKPREKRPPTRRNSGAEARLRISATFAANARSRAYFARPAPCQDKRPGAGTGAARGGPRH